MEYTSFVIDIFGYEKLYAVTKQGEVWCYPKEWIGKVGNKNQIKQFYTHRRKGKFLVGYNQEGRYKLVNLIKNKKSTTYAVHRLVAKAFIPNPNNFPQVNHKNGIKLDNRVENLEWCSAKNNIHHARKVGLINRDPEKHNTTKLSKKQVLEIRSRRGESPIKLGKEYGVSRGSIHNIWSKKTWAELS